MSLKPNRFVSLWNTDPNYSCTSIVHKGSPQRHNVVNLNNINDTLNSQHVNSNVKLISRSLQLHNKDYFFISILDHTQFHFL